MGHSKLKANPDSSKSRYKLYKKRQSLHADIAAATYANDDEPVTGNEQIMPDTDEPVRGSNQMHFPSDENSLASSSVYESEDVQTESVPIRDINFRLRLNLIALGLKQIFHVQPCLQWKRNW